MSHVVFWSAPSGPTFQRVPALADAVDLVQRLRNDHEVTDAEVHSLTSIPLNFRTVVVVEAAGTGSAVAPQTLPAMPPVPVSFESFSAFAPLDDDGEEVAPLGATVPGVVPDPIGPFRSLAAVGGQAAESAAEEEFPTPHLVGLPSVVPDVIGDDEPDHTFRPLEAVAEAIAAHDDAAEESFAAETVSEGGARSLGLFA